MKITGLHLLLTYQCTFECEHCFVWGSPRQDGVMDLQMVRSILDQAHEVESVRTIYFEGGEPFLYYATMAQAVEESHRDGFEVGIVTNAFWATSLEDAVLNLEPLAAKLKNLTVSSDLFHYSEKISRQSQNASLAAQKLGIPTGMIVVAKEENRAGETGTGQLEPGEGGVMYRGRAAATLAEKAPQKDWKTFTTCPYEDLREPGRVHVDPLGYIHLCQGITIGNLLERPLKEIFSSYDPEEHPIVSALLREGPKGLVEAYSLPHQERYADACHLCYQARTALRDQFPEILAPNQVYGIYS